MSVRLSVCLRLSSSALALQCERLREPGLLRSEKPRGAPRAKREAPPQLAHSARVNPTRAQREEEPRSARGAKRR